MVQFFVEIMYPPLNLPLFACQAIVYLFCEMGQNIGQESERGKCYPIKYLKKTRLLCDTQLPDYPHLPRYLMVSKNSLTRNYGDAVYW